MHNHDDKYPPRQGFEHGTPRLQAPVDTNEPSGPVISLQKHKNGESLKFWKCVCLSIISEKS